MPVAEYETSRNEPPSMKIKQNKVAYNYIGEMDKLNNYFGFWVPVTQIRFRGKRPDGKYLMKYNV